MRLQSAGSRQRTEYRTLAGKQVLGEISTLPNDTSDTDFTLPRRVLKVSPAANLNIGEILVTTTGRRYLVADNGDSEQGAAVYRTFRLIEMDRRVTVERRAPVIDPVTGLAKGDSYTTVATVDCVMEFLGQEPTSIQVPKDRYRLVTNFGLLNGDRVAGRYEVKNVETLLGVKVATVS